MKISLTLPQAETLEEFLQTIPDSILGFFRMIDIEDPTQEEVDILSDVCTTLYLREIGVDEKINLQSDFIIRLVEIFLTDCATEYLIREGYVEKVGEGDRLLHKETDVAYKEVKERKIVFTPDM